MEKKEDTNKDAVSRLCLDCRSKFGLQVEKTYVAFFSKKISSQI